MNKREFGSVRQLPSGRWQVKYRHPRTNELIVGPNTFKLRGDATGGYRGPRERSSGASGSTRTGDPSRCGTTRLRGSRSAPCGQGRWSSTKDCLNRYILPSLGRIELGDLSPREVRSWHAALLKRGRPGPVTVAKAYRLLRTICETAFSDELIARNPCNLKGASVEHSPERPVLTVAEVESLAAAIDERFKALVLLAAWCGLRLGEALALTRADIDLEQGTVRIDKSAAELKSGERIVGPPEDEGGNQGGLRATSRRAGTPDPP